MRPMLCKLFIPTPAVEREVELLERGLANYSQSLLCQAVEIAIDRANYVNGEYDYLKALRISAGLFLEEKLKEAFGGHWWENIRSEAEGEYEQSVVNLVVELSEIPTDWDGVSSLYASFKTFIEEHGYLIGLACINISLEYKDSTFTDKEFMEMLEDLTAQESQEDREKVLREWLK